MCIAIGILGAFRDVQESLVINTILIVVALEDFFGEGKGIGGQRIDLLQIDTVLECQISEISDAGRDSNLNQACQPVECTGGNGRNSVRDSCCRTTGYKFVGGSLNDGITVVGRVIELILRIYLNTDKAVVACQDEIVFYLRHALGDVERCQKRIIPEALCANER